MGSQMKRITIFLLLVALLAVASTISYRAMVRRSASVGKPAPISYASPAFNRMVSDSISKSGSRRTVSDFYRLMNSRALQYARSKHAENLFDGMCAVQPESARAFKAILTNEEQGRATSINDLATLLQFLGDRYQAYLKSHERNAAFEQALIEWAFGFVEYHSQLDFQQGIELINYAERGKLLCPMSSLLTVAMLRSCGLSEDDLGVVLIHQPISYSMGDGHVSIMYRLPADTSGRIAIELLDIDGGAGNVASKHWPCALCRKAAPNGGTVSAYLKTGPFVNNRFYQFTTSDKQPVAVSDVYPLTDEAAAALIAHFRARQDLPKHIGNLLRGMETGEQFSRKTIDEFQHAQDRFPDQPVNAFLLARSYAAYAKRLEKDQDFDAARKYFTRARDYYTQSHTLTEQLAMPDDTTLATESAQKAGEMEEKINNLTPPR